MVLDHRRVAGQTPHEAGRCLLAELYYAQTGQPLPPVLTTPRGKPYLEGNPLYFSISHTRHHAFCALSDRPIGIDAEEIDRIIPPMLTEKILSPAEKIRYAAASDKNEALLRLWVLKEARAKFLGTGLTGYPNHTDFSPADSRITQQHGCFVAVIQEEDYAF